MDPNEFSNKKKIGKGTYGKVFMAQYQSQSVVLKEMLLQPNDISQEFLNFFQSECDLLMNLKSPYIVSFLGYYLKPIPTIVLEYAPRSLKKIINEKKKEFSWSEKITISHNIAKGLAFLHNEHILHYDLRADNIMVDGQLNVKISDFGLIKCKEYIRSRLLLNQNYANLNISSLNAWRAPELFEKKSILSNKNDIYSLGMTFWELYSGKTPFSTVSNSVIPMLVLEGEREEIGLDCLLQYSNLIKDCWENEEKRIGLEEIEKILHQMFEGIGNYKEKKNIIADNLSIL